MGLKKKDREKVDMIIDKYVEAFVWCFNEEYTNKYLERFTLMKYESGLYNNDFTHAGLDILNDNDITDTYEGIENEEIKKQKKAEKEKEAEAKGKKNKK